MIGFSREVVFYADTMPDVCRTGCKTKDHKSYGDCLRDGNLMIGNLK